MAALKTLIATGCSSGIGLDVVRQLIAQATPWSVHLAARSPTKATSSINSFPHGSPTTSATPYQTDLLNLASIRTFATSALSALGDDKLDYLLLNAGMLGGERESPASGAKYTDAFVVNHLSQHYLVHLLREKLVASKTRIVFVSSGAVRNVEDVSLIDEDIKAGSETSSKDVWKHYAQTKFVALTGAHWWRRELRNECVVVAVSPGLIPATGLGRVGSSLPMDHPDAKSVEEGAQSIIRAFERDDLPGDEEQIFLTSWGEWWPKEVYGKSLDKNLWDRWCLLRKDIEDAVSSEE